jgi:hypothetical protein
MNRFLNHLLNDLLFLLNTKIVVTIPTIKPMKKNETVNQIKISDLFSSFSVIVLELVSFV